MKRCSRCKQEKPYTDFNANRTKEDLCDTSCRDCSKERYQEKLQFNRNRVREYRQANKEKKNQWNKEYLDRNKDKTIARAKVNHALRDKKIVRPASCEQCLAIVRLEAHHHLGYSPEHWYDVRWLCVECHSKQSDTYVDPRRAPLDGSYIPQPEMFETPNAKPSIRVSAELGLKGRMNDGDETGSSEGVPIGESTS